MRQRNVIAVQRMRGCGQFPQDGGYQHTTRPWQLRRVFYDATHRIYARRRANDTRVCA